MRRRSAPAPRHHSPVSTGADTQRNSGWSDDDGHLKGAVWLPASLRSRKAAHRRGRGCSCQTGPVAQGGGGTSRDWIRRGVQDPGDLGASPVPVLVLLLVLVLKTLRHLAEHLDDADEHCLGRGPIIPGYYVEQADDVEDGATFHGGSASGATKPCAIGGSRTATASFGDVQGDRHRSGRGRGRGRGASSDRAPWWRSRISGRGCRAFRAWRGRRPRDRAMGRRSRPT